MGQLFSALFSAFYSKKMDIVLVGLENSGKSTLLSVLATGEPVETVPTIGLSVKVMKKQGITMKCWDIGGQEKYRGEWGRYTEGCSVILFVVDVADYEKMPTVKKELHKLVIGAERGNTQPIPMLILANKIDKSPHMAETELITKLALEKIQMTPWIVMPISAVQSVGIENVLDWLINQS
ncbi:hypothetical protein TrRE_jg8485 [Triparma retinervis]|uniref:Uncharacterized protein n=1 Tax=Triparma retinervis TaxID=2557542 RepID=A0A9W7DTH8_9STRA|nr:hypothetical protein TrRE_jg8485 [Triparma retinervis]